MKRPDFLKPGDTIAITATGRKVPLDKIELGVAAIEHFGFEAVVSEHIGASSFIFAGDDERRAQALQELFDSPDIKAIWLARGGYGTLRILDRLNWTGFKENPKWLIGFSDVTNLHLEINNKIGYASIHGPMPINLDSDFATNSSVQILFDVLKGETQTFEWKVTSQCKKGRCNGRLAGGNLATLAHSSGSVSSAYFREAILLIEDIDEYLYQIDRMLRSMNRAGCFKEIKGVLVGQFSDIKDNDDPFGESLQEIVLNTFTRFDIPIAFGFQAGHEQPNWSVKLGSQYELLSNNGQWSLHG